MKFMLVVPISMGSPVTVEEKKTFELRIPQENKQRCDKSAKALKLALPVICMDAICVPQKYNVEFTIQSI